MNSTRPNPENSPEFLRKTGERSPEELDARWDTLAEDAPPFAGEDSNSTQDINFEIKHEQASEIANEGSDFEHEHDEPIYEKVYSAPTYADGVGNSEYNARFNEYLTKGFWRRVIGYHDNDDGIQVNKITDDYHPPVLENKLEYDDLQSFSAENYDQEIQKQDALVGLNTEGGELKSGRLSESDVSLDATANIYELSRRADISVSDIAEACKGMPEVRESISELVAAAQQIAKTESSSSEELATQYESAIAAAKRVRGQLANADAPVQLTGAIMSRLIELEEKIRENQSALLISAENKTIESPLMSEQDQVSRLDQLAMDDARMGNNDLSQSNATPENKANQETTAGLDQANDQLAETVADLAEISEG